MPSFIIASNRLPCQLDSDGNIQSCAGGLVSALSGIIDSNETTWIGSSIAPSSREHRIQQDLYFETNGIEAVYLSKMEHDGYYNGYSNSALWPLLHYLYEFCEYDPEWFVHYKSVNQQFAQKISQIATPGASVWIHDYHLLLLPGILRKLRPDLKIGFFLHTPFPSSEIFRALPEREELLSGLMACDLVGFHTYGYLRHFQSSILRITGHHSESGTLSYNGNTCNLGVFPIGHDFDSFEQACHHPSYKDLRAKIQQRYRGKNIVLGVERIDYTKGIPEKLRAIRHFLTHNPKLSDQTIFVLIAVPSRCEINHYKSLKSHLIETVSDINNEFGNSKDQPVELIASSFESPELAAYYAEAHACMVIPIIDGMNLVAKEFIACKSPQHNATPGTLILSEFAGAAEEMKDALLVNPFDTLAVSRAIKDALLMSNDDIAQRTNTLLKRVTVNSATAWARRYIDELNHTSHKTKCFSLSHTSMNAIFEVCRTSVLNKQKVSLFLDYDGTLTEFFSRPEEAVPSKKLLRNLRAIANQPFIELTIISGRPVDFLEQHFANLPIQLIAEHGAFQRKRNSLEWIDNSHKNEELQWKPAVLEVVGDSVLGTPGSEIENKKHSIVWHFRQVDPEYGEWQANRLKQKLEALAKEYPISIQCGHKIVEVCHTSINKGQAVMQDIKTSLPHLAICVGDDVTDESMFGLTPPAGTSLYSVKVGEGITVAKHRTTIARLAEFLSKLAHPTKNAPRSSPNNTL